jgi:hypothetical protein
MINYDRDGITQGNCLTRDVSVHDNDIWMYGNSNQRSGGWDDRTLAPVNDLYAPASNNTFSNNIWHVASLNDTHWAWNDNQNQTFSAWQQLWPTETRVLI